MSEPDIHATFNGEPLRAPAGSTVGAALLAAGHPTWRTTRSGAQRGLFCGIGVCYDCLIVIDGQTQRACLAPLLEGMALTEHAGDADPTGGGGDPTGGTGA